MNIKQVLRDMRQASRDYEPKIDAATVISTIIVMAAIVLLRG